MNLLLVDDEPMVLNLLKKRVDAVLPEATQYAFTKASEALACANEKKIDIAFLDINMRVMDGITMAKELQKINPMVNVIFCTGYTEYMPDAFELYCSGYLVKPVTEEKIRAAVEHLRYPVEEKRVMFRCFGNFEVFCDDKPIPFKYSRTKELLAYLVDRNGADVTTGELMAVLFEDDDHRVYFNQLRRDLIVTFTELGIDSMLRVSKGKMGIERAEADCDYFDFLDGKNTTKPTEYMRQYSFSEETFPLLADF